MNSIGASAKLPPQSLAAEMAVLGSTLIEKEAAETALEILNENDFYPENHRIIFQAIISLRKVGRGIDLVTLEEELRKTGNFEAIGGREYLVACINTVVTAAHVEHYSAIVRDKSALRRLISALSSSQADCYSEREPSIILDDAQARILGVTVTQSGKAFVDSKSMMHDAIDQIEKLHKDKRRITGVRTGFAELDAITAGLQCGDLILIAARPSQGKTALALSIAANVITGPKPVGIGFLSMEMSESAISSRLIAMEAGMSLHDVRRGYFKTALWTNLTNAAARIAAGPLFVDDSSNLSVLEIRRRLRTLARHMSKTGTPLGMVIIDYIQIMRGSSTRVENRQLEVAEISRGLKALAKDLNVPVIALSQLSRRVEENTRTDGRPRLSDLRDSGALEQDADVVMLIYREGASKPKDPSIDQSKAEIIIAKQRQGATGSVPLRFNSDLARFENIGTAANDSDDWSQGSFNE